MILRTSRHLITATLLLALTTPAAALDKANAALMPPKFWDHPFGGELIEKIVTMEDMNRMCRPRRNYQIIPHGCSNPQFTKCTIWILESAVLQKSGILIDVVRRHEIAHCNGWPGDHPGMPEPEPMISNEVLQKLQEQVGR